MDDLETTPCEHYWRSLRQEDRLGRYPVIAYEPFTDKNGRQYNRRRVSFVEKIVAFDIFYCQKCLSSVLYEAVPPMKIERILALIDGRLGE